MGWKPFKKLIDNRHERKMARIEGKTERVEARQETKQAAYAAGIDPNEAVFGALGDVAKSATAAFAGGATPTAALGALAQPQARSQAAGMSPMIMMVIAAVVLFMFMGKKR